MKNDVNFRLACLAVFVALVLGTTRLGASSLASDATSDVPTLGVELVSPSQDAGVSIAPAALLEYRTADERGWDLQYDPESVKHGVSECSHPTPVVFEWRGGSGDYELELSLTPDFASVKRYATSEPRAEADNLDAGTVYYWRVKTIKGGEPFFSETRRFSTARDLPRWFNVPGVSNFRDLGGWRVGNAKRVKSGMLYRGTEMDGHFALEESGKRFMLEELGIRVDFDLRGPGEWGNVPDYSSPLGPSVRWLNFRIVAYDAIFKEDQKKLYREIFRTLADPETYPTYIHCWGGADRTGTLCMAIEAALGVGDSDLIADYEATSFSVIGRRYLGSKEMQAFLKGLEEYGSEGDSLSVKFVNYLLSIGVTQEELDKIRALLLEDEYK